ncbi:MAG: prolipoprotein diacylglyceryl transferase [Cyclobacteriaceae bacterium]|nr:prolipoprotein diacylglyceryl transferase [Cyclobacteriaceae bacterium]
MHPEFFTIGNFTIHTYGFMIMLGALSGYLYLTRTAKKELGIETEQIQNLAIFIVIAAFVGGKFFFYLEEPSYYFETPAHMWENFRQGFVFYGSLIFAIPVAIWYFKKEKWPLWPLMDRLAITATIIHSFGRMGCFFAGCCYGIPTTSWTGVTFTDAHSQAMPLNTPLHPTQLYDVFNILVIMGILLLLKRQKKFEGQLFFIYVILYAINRSVIEVFRGDLRRGFIIDDVLSHSQFISLVLIALTTWAYLKFQRKARFQKGVRKK